MLTVMLEGFCALKFNADHLAVLTPEGHAPRHFSALVGRADQTDLTAANSRQPDYMFTASTGTPFHVWFLRGLQLEIGASGKAVPTWVSANDEDLLIDFGKKHNNVTTKNLSINAGNGSMTFNAGHLAHVPNSVHSFNWIKNGAHQAGPVDYAERFEWYGDERIVVQDGTQIAFKTGLAGGPRVTIANTSPGPHGLTHFGCYYHLFSLDPNDATEVPLTIEYANVAATKALDPDFGNCIPPGKLV